MKFMKTKWIFWILFSLLSPSLISCSEQYGAFQEAEEVNREISLSSQQTQEDLNERLRQFQRDIERANDPNVSQEERASIFSSVQEGMNEMHGDLKNVFEAQAEALQTEFEALNCVSEKDSHFQALNTRTQDRCKKISHRLNEVRTWRNTALTPLGDVNQLTKQVGELSNGEVNLFTLIGSINSISNIIELF